MAQLPFLAVGRVEDSTTLASFCPDTIEQAQQRDTEDVFRKLLTAAGKKLRHGEKTRLQWNDGSVCCLMDNNKVLLYCVVTSDLQYPERLAYGMLVDLMKIVDRVQRETGNIMTIEENKLTSFIRSDMQSLMEKYEDPNQWQSLMNAQNQVSSAQSPAAENENSLRVNKAPQAQQAAQGGGIPKPILFAAVAAALLLIGFIIVRMTGGSDDTTTLVTTTEAASAATTTLVTAPDDTAVPDPVPAPAPAPEEATGSDGSVIV